MTGEDREYERDSIGTGLGEAEEQLRVNCHFEV